MQQLDRGAPRLTSGTWLSFIRASLAGAPALAFFGFTHCPDVCPATLSRLAQVRKAAALPALHVLFVSVYSERDSPALRVMGGTSS